MRKDIPLINRGFSDINPLVCGYHECEKGYSYGPAIREHYLIHYIVRGEGIICKHGKESTAKQGDIFIIYPDEVTTYYADRDDPWHYIWVGFSGQMASRLRELDKTVYRQDANLFLEMLQAENFENMREEFLAGKLFMLFSSLFETQKKDNYVQRAVNFMDANYMQSLRIEDIAQMLKIDKRYFSRIFKSEMGLSPKEHLINLKLNKACDLLKRGFSVSESAGMVGYEDQFNFYKIFMKKYGVAPSTLKGKGSVPTQADSSRALGL